jgi:hypothetical protein
MNDQIPQPQPEHAVTLRDLIAMSALGGTLGRVERVTGREHEIAAHCYALADAMLAVRAQGQGPAR